jgi:hypothetical protein
MHHRKVRELFGAVIIWASQDDLTVRASRDGCGQVHWNIIERPTTVITIAVPSHATAHVRLTFLPS